jgi:hypothetical protein
MQGIKILNLEGDAKSCVGGEGKSASEETQNITSLQSVTIVL